MNPFFESVLKEIPRLLGNVDRNPLSGTYGAADRAYWLYRTNTINAARYQEALLTLTLLYAKPFEGNTWHRSRELGEWIRATARFTISIQRSDGSFDEWYPHEGSFVCTAFVTAALAEALLIAPDLFPKDETEAVLRKSAHWLAARNEKHVCNQLAGAVTALALVGRVTGESFCTEAAQTKFEQLLALQDAEGWWAEYGGPDIGYLTLTIDYLSRYWELTHDARAKEALERAVTFVSYFLTPDGTAGGECFARNTEYIIPSGVARMASVNDDAHRIVAYCAANLVAGKGITPDVLDDRYLCYMLSNWLRAGFVYEERECAPAQNVTMFFPNAGVFVERTENRIVICNVRKGGSFRIYHGGRRAIDAGSALVKGGQVLSAQVLGSTGECRGETIVVRGNMVPMKARLMTPLVHIGFSLFQLTVGRMSFVQKILKHTLRRVLVRTHGASDVSYTRTFTLTAASVTVVDEVRAINGEVSVGGRGVFALVPSTRYENASSFRALVGKETRAQENGVTRVTRVFNT